MTGSARKLITQVSLFGSVSSTAFWPLTQWLFEEVGWRNTLFVFAAANLLICTPIYAVCLRKAKPLVLDRTVAPPTAAELKSGRRDMIFFTAADVAPKFYPVLSSFPAVVSCWADEATGACVEPLA